MTGTSSTIVTVIGGSGFIGRHAIRALARRGYRVRAGVRRPDLAGHLQPLGDVGQIRPVQVNVRYPESIQAACEGADIVINLVGTLNNAGAQSFDALHVYGARSVATAAAQAGASRFIQFSAIGASSQSPAGYGRSKAQGEEAAREAFANVQILRPSVVFGPEDEFFNRFAAMARFSPVLPVISGGTRLQPVSVNNVAEAVARLCEGQGKPGAVYELGGPQIMTLKEVMAHVLDITGRQRLLLPVPFMAAKALGAILQYLPGKALTMDQVMMLKADNVVSQAATSQGRTLEGLGIRPQAVDAIVPDYLYRYRKAGQYSAVSSDVQV